MSLKLELETWAAAVDAYDAKEFENALNLFSRIERSSKIATNMGLIYAALREHKAAVEQFTEATGFDTYLAVAYFQCGDFERAMLALRGNPDINYEQVGLKFRLYSAEVLFNQGLSLIYMGRTREGLATDDHNVIDKAIAECGKDFTVFSIGPVAPRPAAAPRARGSRADGTGRGGGGGGGRLCQRGGF
ncbi:hypothetical protein B0H13DRAFT_2236420 [Mycena leptocephala]|nr:hypothetical protein B0H13DRAFT_2236420 [Mycena leptocephala]